MPSGRAPAGVQPGGGSAKLPPPGRARRRWRRETLPALGFLTPFLVLLLIFQYLPLAVMARYSLYDYSLFNPSQAKFVGAQNFIQVFTDPATLQSLLITFIFILGVVALVVPISFIVAVYLNGKLPARALVRTMIFLPVVTSSVVVATLWTFLLNQTGLINSLLQAVHLPPAGFLTDKHQALATIVVMTVWQQLGLASVLFLAGLQSVPRELYEAAEVDGAGVLRRTVSITIPLISRTTLFIVVVMTVFALQAFAPAYIMTGGAPEGTTNLIIYQIYQTAFQLQQPGYASAMSIVVLLFAIVISLIQMRLLRTRWNY